jgi:hypothetical protein
MSPLTACMTPTQHKILARAAKRDRRNICPTPELRGNIQRVVLDSLYRRGWAIYDNGAPRITDAGITAIRREADA